MFNYNTMDADSGRGATPTADVDSATASRDHEAESQLLSELVQESCRSSKLSSTYSTSRTYDGSESQSLVSRSGREPSVRKARRMDKLRSTKFAQILGFGLENSESVGDGDSLPVHLDNILDSPPIQGRHHDDDGDATPHSLGTAPLEPSFYRFGLGSVDAQWGMNYKEASIYLEEGDNNDQFSTHPKRKENLPAYIMAHTSWFYVLDLMASLLLLALAAFEPPAVTFFQVPIPVHASLELGALVVIGFCLVLKLRWLGYKTILTHHRTSVKAATLLIMIVEAIFVLVRQSSHFRVTRALRPIFVIDNRYCRGVRRFSREILQSLPPILDMLVLLFFFIFIFTLLGHFLFKEVNQTYFLTFETSFVSLFVLLTTANYPDVMMPSYYENRLSVIFFVTYLVSVLYLFMNLLLAVVYDTFTSLEIEKFRKLVIHKRKACQFAYSLLISKSNTHGISFRHFHGMMREFQPKATLLNIYLVFRALDKTGDGVLNREEFCRFFEVAGLKWKPVHASSFQKEWIFFGRFGNAVQRFLNSSNSDHIFNGIIVLNTAAMLARWAAGSSSHESWDAFIFALVFLCEMGLKIITWGFQRVISSGWHSFDLIASVVFLFSLVIVLFIPGWNELLTFIRPLRLLRLFKLKKRYRNVFGTLFILMPPMSSAAIVILLMYYFYAIIGMELFFGIPLKNCCNGTGLEAYYSDEPTNTTLRYYINTFDNLFSSAVTLFELTVVNNWYVIMEGHALVTNHYSRIFFMSFYLVTMILLTIIVAFILDAFLFRMQYKRAMDKTTEQKMLRTEISLSAEEIEFCFRTNSQSEKAQILEDFGEDLANRGCITFVGWRRRNKEILFKRMFKNEIPDWLRESEPILAINH